MSILDSLWEALADLEASKQPAPVVPAKGYVENVKNVRNAPAPLRVFTPDPPTKPTEPQATSFPEPLDEWEPPAPSTWRTVIARWPEESRRRWGLRANELEAEGMSWNTAEWLAFCELSP